MTETEASQLPTTPGVSRYAGPPTKRAGTQVNQKIQELIGTPLEPLALQLAGHVESIRGNLQQAEDITPQLARSKAALQNVLHRYLENDTYEQVVLG